MTGLPTIFGRLAAIALAVAVVAVALAGGVLPIAERLAELDEKKRTAADTIDRLSARMRDRDGLAERMSDMRARLLESEMSVQAATPPLGAAKMQRFLTEAAELNGLELASVQILPVIAEGGFQRIGLAADLSGPLTAVAGFLYKLESAKPYLFVETIGVRSVQGMAAAAEDTDPILSLHTKFFAYMVELER